MVDTHDESCKLDGRNRLEVLELLDVPRKLDMVTIFNAQMRTHFRRTILMDDKNDSIASLGWWTAASACL